LSILFQNECIHFYIFTVFFDPTLYIKRLARYGFHPMTQKDVLDYLLKFIFTYQTKGTQQHISVCLHSKLHVLCHISVLYHPKAASCEESNTYI